jgi:hypothetical protein
MTVKEIVEKYLKENKFDGLFYDGCACGCGLEDLMPCGDNYSGCEAGYKYPCNCDEEHNFHIRSKKPKRKK